MVHHVALSRPEKFGSIPSMTDVRTIERPDAKLLTLYVLGSLLLGPCFLIALIPAYFKYQTLRYRFDDEGVSMSWGILWRQEINLTYARIQDIHLSRGVLERWLGIATIEVQTASGKSTAEMALVGIRDYDAVRDFLYSKMRGGEETSSSSAERALTPSMAPVHSGELVKLLGDIRDSLEEARKIIEKNGGEPRV